MLKKLSWDRCSKMCSDSLEFFELACTPVDEDCVQAGSGTDLMRMECEALAAQLTRMYGPPPEGAEFIIVRNQHEFGDYYELGIFYIPSIFDENEEEIVSPSMEYAQKVESGMPSKWDQDAINYLKEMEYTPMMPKAPAKVVKHQGKIIKINSETA